jgi:hypothetical protein
VITSGNGGSAAPKKVSCGRNGIKYNTMQMAIRKNARIKAVGQPLDEVYWFPSRKINTGTGDSGLCILDVSENGNKNLRQ